MKTTPPMNMHARDPFIRRTKRLAEVCMALCITGVLMLSGWLSHARAATWYLQADQPAADNWTTLADWYSQPLGGGTHPAVISGSDTFDNNSCLLRTPTISSGTAIFGGGTLVLDGGQEGSLALKTISPAVCVMSDVISYGTKISNSSAGVLTVNITTLANFGNTTFSTGASNRGLSLTIGTLTGNGDLTAVGVSGTAAAGGTVGFNVTSATGYYGTLYIADGCQFTFSNAITSRGTLDVSGTGTKVTVNATVTFSGLTLNGTAKGAGTYSASSLGFAGTGSVVVKAPASWYLHASQGLSDDWNTLADWFSTPAGGSNPTAISSNDDFFTNGFTLRTPNNSSAATFGGALLTLNGGTFLLKDTSTSTATTIGNFASSGGTVSNGTGGNLLLLVTDFLNKGTTTFDTGSGTRGFNLGVSVLSGTGNFSVLCHGGGTMHVAITDAYSFSGTFVYNSTSTGAVTFGSDIFMAGALNFGGGNTVTLNNTLTVGGLTVSGVVKPAGSYTAGALGFTGTGSINVLNRPVPMLGVNLPGGTFSSVAIYPTDPAEWAYYQGKGFKLARVGFLWQRVQPTLSGTLDTATLSSLDTVMSLAASHGMKVLLDMHNYDRYPVSGTSYLVGTTQVPYTAYQDVWHKLAAHFAGSPALYGYDIMNEPNGTGGTWPTAAQYGVNGVRQGDTTHYVIVEGDSYAGAQSWMSVNANLNVTDSAKLLVYSAHTYWDSNNSGVYAGTYDSNDEYPTIGVDRVASFVHWLKIRKAWGLIGEYGVPNNVASPDPRWNVALNNFLAYLQDNGVSGTYWSGGECWGIRSHVRSASRRWMRRR